MGSKQGYHQISSILTGSVGVLKRFVISEFGYLSLNGLEDMNVTLNLSEGGATSIFFKFLAHRCPLLLQSSLNLVLSYGTLYVFV